MTTYATWNPSDKSSYITLSNGNLTTTLNSALSYRCARATIGKSSGKWYWEIHIDNGLNSIVGIGISSASLEAYLGGTSYGWGYGENSGKKYHGGGSAYGASFTTGDVVSVALDLDNGEIWWAKNGTWQASGNPVTRANPAFTGISGTVYPMICHRYIDHAASANFGASAFVYTVPSGFNAGIYDAISEQTELEDASLDLAAYYRGQSDLKAFLCAHDGVEFRDLAAHLETAGWNIADFASALGAYYQSLSDARMNLETWATHYDDLQMPLAAWLQQMSDAGVDLSAYYQALSNGRTRLEAAALVFRDMAAYLSAVGQSFHSMPCPLQAALDNITDLGLLLEATNGIVLSNLGCFLYTTDGTITRDMGLCLRAVSQAPLFKTMTAQRISSVVSEVV